MDDPKTRQYTVIYKILAFVSFIVATGLSFDLLEAMDWNVAGRLFLSLAAGVIVLLAVRYPLEIAEAIGAWISANPGFSWSSRGSSLWMGRSLSTILSA